MRLSLCEANIKERSTKCDLNNINLTMIKLMEQHQVSPRENLKPGLHCDISISIRMTKSISKGCVNLE